MTPYKHPCRPASDPVTSLLRSRWRGGAVASLAAAGLTYLAISQAQSNQPFVDQPLGWVNRVVLSNNDLTSGKEAVYRGEFNNTDGSGLLLAYNVSATGTVLTSSPWANADAGVLLKAKNHATGRRVFTRNSAGTAVPFVWNSISPGQQALLGDSVNGPRVLSYLRGDASNEGTADGQFRIRRTPLGGIEQSTLVRWDHLTGTTSAKRLYVGANDGMLHAFDASTGEEVFAYVPSMLFNRLATLASPSYVPQLYVNGPLSIADIQSGGAAKTVLVGGLGGGGMGLFGLDVTNPNAASDADAARKLMWEITPNSTGFANLGFTYSTPRLARLQDGTPAVIVGNGYGNQGNGQASLMIINANTGALIREIGTSTGSLTAPNGLSSPTLLDVDGDGKADFAYAGDLQGHLWKFSLNSTGSPGFTASKLFTTSPAQAITTAPSVRRHPSGGHMVIFGTGKALINADLSDASVHSVYGIWDGAPVGHTALLSQTVTEVLVEGKRWRTTTNNLPEWDTSASSKKHRGWQLTLPAGERLLGETPFISDNRFVFTGMNPTTRRGTNHGPGENWLMQVNFLTGGNLTQSIFDVNNSGVVTVEDMVSNAVVNGRFVAHNVTSQPTLTNMTSLARTFFNYSPEISMNSAQQPGSTTSTTTTTTPPLTSPGGVSNGHFDVDIYKGGISLEHTHEYDDKFNVVGVNFLAPSQTEFDVKKIVEDDAVEFKILVVNQYLNPASLLQIGPKAEFVRVKDFQRQASANNVNFIRGLPTFQRKSIENFVWMLPTDAFQSKDWWGDGGVSRAGLIPTQTGCVKDGPYSSVGKNGEIYNGALTLQLVRADTPPEAIEPNFQAGGSKYGWRVKKGQRSTYVIGEYTMFWHHPNDWCYHDKGWVPNPPQDRSASGKSETPAPGANDPKAGVTGGPGDGPVSVVDQRTTVNGNVTTTVYTYSDGSTRTDVTTVVNTPGSNTTSSCYRDGCEGGVNDIETSTTLGGPNQIKGSVGRFSWREVLSQ